MKEVWSKYNQIHMEIWNSKIGHNKHSKFEVKFRVFSKVIFEHVIFHFKVWEVKSPTRQIMCKSELKWESYVC